MISDKIDLLRAIEQRNYCRYEIESQGILKNVGIDIDPVFTPFSYYILVFVGILSILLTPGHPERPYQAGDAFPAAADLFHTQPDALRVSDIFTHRQLRHQRFHFPGPRYDLSFIFSPAILLQYSLQYPLRNKLFNKFSSNVSAT